MTRFVFWPALIALPLFAIIYALVARRRPEGQTYTGPFDFGSDPTRLAWIPAAMTWMGLMLLTVALARPQSGFERLPSGGEGVDIMLSLDISTSMLGEDYSPNRLEAAKRAALSFIEGRPNDRIGLVIYAGQASTICPPTFDHSTLENFIREVEPGYLMDGTAIGQGLAVAASGLDYSQTDRRVIVLLSDGVETSGTIDPITVARAVNTIHGDSLRVYTVAIGTTVAASGYQVDRQTLSSIAEINGGRLFDAYSESDLRTVYQSIDSLEASTLPSEGLFVYRDHYLLYLILGLILLMAGKALGWSVLKVVGE